MTKAAEQFRANKAARIKQAKSLLAAFVASGSPAEQRHATEVEEIIDELNDLVEQAVRVKAEMISAAIDSRARTGQPAICSSCIRLLTETEEQLGDYIELVVTQARNVSWPEDVCRAKLGAAMKPGDRVGLLSFGRVTIVKPDGTAFVIYQRDS